MKHVQYRSFDPEKDLLLLKEAGIKDIYEIEDSTSSILGGFTTSTPDLNLEKILYEEAEVDWESQWSAFSHNDGVISLEEFGGPASTLHLIPGGGFGDVSHPTTKLMLHLMCTTPLHEPILDVGCGSGILTLAAHKLGYKSLYAYDISADAVEHTQKNLVHNDASAKLSKILAPKTILINMTLAEQQIAVEGLTADLWIVSGIHNENVPAFTAWVYERGLQMQHSLSLENWHAYVLTSSPFQEACLPSQDHRPLA